RHGRRGARRAGQRAGVAPHRPLRQRLDREDQALGRNGAGGAVGLPDLPKAMRRRGPFRSWPPRLRGVGLTAGFRTSRSSTDGLMPFLLNTPDDVREMLEAIGVGSLDELFAMVPQELRLGRELAIPPALTELELTSHLEALARQNVSA